MTNETDDKMMIGSVKLTFAILESLTEHQPARVITLADDLDISRSTIYKHLKTLESIGYVEKRGVSYTITDSFRRFTDTKPTSIDLNQDNQQVVDSITNMTGEICGIYLPISTVTRREKLHLPHSIDSILKPSSTSLSCPL
jgi:DNA-binding IclR family transcriptional regulator